jgi:hypothetical protein
LHHDEPIAVGMHHVAADGRFLIRRQSDTEPTKIHVALNWLDELERLVAAEN